MPVALSIMMHCAGCLTATSTAFFVSSHKGVPALWEATFDPLIKPRSRLQVSTPSSSTRHSFSSPLGCDFRSSLRIHMPEITALATLPSLLHKPVSLTN